MEKTLAPYSDFIYAAFRIIVGLLFACHGAQKLLGWFGGGPPEMNALLWLAGTIELVGGLLVAVGFQASIAAFVASGQMAVAYFMVHQPMDLFPIVNKGELAILYCFAFLLIAARGSGKLSVDDAMR